MAASNIKSTLTGKVVRHLILHRHYHKINSLSLPRASNNKTCHSLNSSRSYMSSSFECKEVWQERLKIPPISTLDINKYYFELERKYTRDGQYLPIDLDIFANALLKPDGSHTAMQPERIQDRLDQMQEMLQRFRQTPQTNFMRPSTSHAVVRVFLEGNGTDKLLQILEERMKYGVFPDDFSVALMLNHFLKEQPDSYLRDASKVAILMMLQEEYDIPIASEMGVLAAYQYTNTEDFRDKNEEDANWNPIKTVLPPEPEDEVKVRVWFEDNNYFDDHFDITKREHLIGKTLAKFAQCSKRQFLHGPGDENIRIVRNSLELLGWCLYEKWDKFHHVIKSIENQGVISKDCMDAINFFANKAKDNEDKESAVSSMNSLKTNNVDISNYLSDCVKASISENEAEVISDQVRTYKGWIKERDDEIKMKLREEEIRREKQNFEQRRQELEREEAKLFFFENFEQIEKEKQAKYREWRKTFPPKSGIKTDPNKPNKWRYKGEK